MDNSIHNKNNIYSQESIYVKPDENIIPTEETFLPNQYNETNKMSTCVS